MPSRGSGKDSRPQAAAGVPDRRRPIGLRGARARLEDGVLDAWEKPMANLGCKLATMAACSAPAWAWAGGDLSMSLGVADAFAALCYLGAPTLIALAVAKGGRAKQTQDPSERRRDLREMAACAVAGLALLAMPSAMLDSTVGLGAPSALQAREGGQARDQAPAVGGNG